MEGSTIRRIRFLAIAVAAAASLLVAVGCGGPGAAPVATQAPAKAAEPTKAPAAPAATTPAAAAEPAKDATPAASQPAASGAAVEVKLGLVTRFPVMSRPLANPPKMASIWLSKKPQNRKGQDYYGRCRRQERSHRRRQCTSTKLITRDLVNGLIGSVSSKVSIPISEVAQSNKVVMISPPPPTRR